MKKKFDRSLDSLQQIFEFTERFFTREGIDASVRFPVDLAVEELFTNMVKYNADAQDEIQISLDRKDDSVIVSLIDFDSEPFDVSRPYPVDVEAPLDERKPGRLGLYLVHHMVDTVDYDYDGRRSTVTFKAKLGGVDV